MTIPTHRERYLQILKEFSSRFLPQGEAKNDALLELLRVAFDALPEDISGLPYVGGATDDRRWLEGFEQIPVAPLPSGEALHAAMQSFRGQIKWHEPAALHNVTPPILLETVAVTAMAALYNGNCLWDFVSAGIQEVEQQVVRQMMRLARWPNDADGVFTFGGKGGFIYAIRLGLNRAIPGFASTGFASCNRPPVVIATLASHYTVETACSLVGLGTAAVHRAATYVDASVDLDDLERVMLRALDAGHPIAAVITSGGDTLHNGMDPVRRVAERVGALSERFQLPYRPWIHHDAVLGWPWLFFRDYPFDENPLEIGGEAVKIIRHAAGRIVEVDAADSFSVDFHKVGLTPYISSVFLAKNGAELHSLYKPTVNRITRGPHGENLTQHHTIEHSRACGPVVAAWVALQCAGELGLQVYIANLTEVAVEFRNRLPAAGFEILNPWSKGFCTMCWVPAPTGPMTWGAIVASGSSAIDAANRYNNAFFRYLAGLDNTRQEQKYVLGYIPSYMTSLDGTAIGALRIYPMSPHITKELAAVIATELGLARQAFARQIDGIDAPAVRVQQVPR
jgi:glutamate/tyrosine decarboxylase-like PLP-dependent enzyme